MISKASTPPKAASNEIEQQRDEKFIRGACCKDCWHSYLVRINPTDIKPNRICLAAPPTAQLIGAGQAVSVQLVPRLVPDNYFCHAWRDRPPWEKSLQDGPAPQQPL